MPKVKKQPKQISNRRAQFDYSIKDTLIVGVELSGAETKAVRNSHASLRGAYVNILNNELWLINATISGSSAAPISDSDQTRSRKLLAKRKEIEVLARAKTEGSSIVPLAILNGGRYIKLKIAIGVGKKLYDKRAVLKTRDENRRIHNYSHRS